MRAPRSFCSPRLIVAAAAFLAVGAPVRAQGDRLLHGKVVTQDGSPLPKPAAIERSCGGRNPVRVAGTNKLGEYAFSEAMSVESVGECYWRAVLAGYESTLIDQAAIQRSSLLPDFVLHSTSEEVPTAAAVRWNTATRALEDGRWADAEALLRPLTAQFPQSAPIWAQLGVALANQDKRTEARQAYRQALAKVPWFHQAYHLLASLDMNDDAWDQAASTVAGGLKTGPSAQLYLDLAEIRFHQNAEGAEYAALQAIALDKKRELPRAEYVLGMILSGGEDTASAATHLKKYLELLPNAPDAQSVRVRIRALEAGESVGPDAGPSPAESAEDSADANGEYAVPGGIKALAAIAHLKRTPSRADFFLEFCRAVADDAEIQGRGDVPGFPEAVATYLAAVDELSRLADAGRISLGADTVANYERTVRAMKALGWKPGAKGGGVFELSELPEDSSRQRAPAALGMDEAEMMKSLAGGGSYQIEVRADRVPLMEARAWRALMGRLPPGGFAEAFVRNPRFAAAYAALAGMGPGAASAVVSGIGLKAFVNRYAELARYYGPAFGVADGRAALPGGREAEAVWQRMAGASPADPKLFFRALMEKDQGRLAAFYHALWRGDAAHQRFFTRTSAEAFYTWYKTSDELRYRVTTARASWRFALFCDLPLEPDGSVHWPGGKAAWTDVSRPDDQALLALPSLEALVPLAKLEAERKVPLDAASARLLAGHYTAWRPLMPYFEKLPALGAAEFQALAAFETAASAQPAAARNTVLGEWHSLVMLIELGARAGTLDPESAARSFRKVCEALSARNYSAGAIAALREMMGGADDLDEAAPSGLLRLHGPQRESFDRVKDLLQAPGLGAQVPSDDRTLAALSGLVYAAVLDPEVLLVSEDPSLLSKHRYVREARGAPLFLSSRLELRNEGAGSYFEGGFMTFEQEVKMLARAGAPRIARPDPAAPSPAAMPAATPPEPARPTEVTFRTNARLVEAYATVTDDRGRYVDDLSADDFAVADGGAAVRITAFESRTTGVSVALAMDTTGSMKAALPALKSSALKLIDDLRPVDSVAVYSFNSKVSELQPFTRNRDMARRAILRTSASGSTGFYDALVRVARDFSGRPGKKAIVVFTDGVDNASALTSDAAIKRAKSEGVAIYTIAQGEAVRSAALLAQLQSVASATGGLAYAIREPGEIRAVFEHIAQDLQHGYLLTFQPAPDEKHKWQPIQVTMRAPAGRTVRAREGYYPD